MSKEITIKGDFSFSGDLFYLNACKNHIKQATLAVDDNGHVMLSGYKFHSDNKKEEIRSEE